MQLINAFIAGLAARVMTLGQERDEEEGQTLVEYALIIALISLLVIALAVIVKDPLTTEFNKIANALKGS